DAMNKGLKLSQGKYIVYMNAGDEFYDEKTLDKISSDLFKNEVNVLYGPGQVIYPKENRWTMRDHSLDIKTLRSGSMPVHQCIYISSEKLKKIGGFDLNYKIAADFELLFRLLSEDLNILHLTYPLSKFYKGGVSTQYSEGDREAYKAI